MRKKTPLNDMFRILLNKLKKWVLSGLGEHLSIQERSLLLQAELLNQHGRPSKLTKLSDAEYRVFSQWGEDGIIDWMVTQLPNINRSFVEFGVQNFRESNTRFLMMSRNWRGLVIDGAEKIFVIFQDYLDQH